MTNCLLELLRNNLIPVLRSDSPADTDTVHAAVYELLSTGIIVDPDALVGLDADTLVSIVYVARHLRGADRHYRTLFPNFPHGVKNMTEVENLITQLRQYLNYYEDLTASDTVYRDNLPEAEQFNGTVMVAPLTPEECADKFKELVNSTTVLAAHQVTLLSALAHYAGPDARDHLIEATRGAKFVENIGLADMALVSTARDETDRRWLACQLISTARTPDSLLRSILAVYLGEKGAARGKTFNPAPEVKSTTIARLKLNSHSRLHPIPRRIRALIVEKAAETAKSGPFFADMFLARKNLWRRVLSSIHAFEHIHTERQKELLDVIFDNSPTADTYMTLNQVVDAGIKGEMNVDTAIATLVSESPARLLRNIVSFTARDADAVCKHLGTPLRAPLATLISAVDALRLACDKGARIRTFAGGKSQFIDEDARLSVVDAARVEQMLRISINHVLEQAPAPETGVVDIAGGGFPVPRSVDTRSETLTDRQRMLPGERMQLQGTGSTLRFFMHWVGSDLDLGVTVFDAEFNVLDVVSYDTVYMSRPVEWFVFSGDVTYAPEPGAAEFVDIDVPKLLQAYPHARYVVSTVTDFSGHGGFSKVDNFSGVMRRAAVNSGEVFEPRTVATGATVQADTSMCVTLMVDLEGEELVWVDADAGHHEWGGSAAQNSENVVTAVRGVLDSPRVSVSELLVWWANAHGAVVHRDGSVDLGVVLKLLR